MQDDLGRYKAPHHRQGCLLRGNVKTLLTKESLQNKQCSYFVFRRQLLTPPPLMFKTVQNDLYFLTIFNQICSEIILLCRINGINFLRLNICQLFIHIYIEKLCKNMFFCIKQEKFKCHSQKIWGSLILFLQSELYFSLVDLGIFLFVLFYHVKLYVISFYLKVLFPAYFMHSIIFPINVYKTYPHVRLRFWVRGCGTAGCGFGCGCGCGCGCGSKGKTGEGADAGAVQKRTSGASAGVGAVQK